MALLHSYYESHAIKMSRPQDIYFDYNARQQHLRERARASSRRPRNRWPPLPYAEEELVSLSHELRPDPPDAGGKVARSRGSLDQQPIILEVNPPASEHHPHRWRETGSQDRNRSPSNDDTSSDESSGPETPTDPGSGDEERNRDRRYVFIPQEGVEIPLTYDEPRTPILAKRSESQARVRSDRGRGNVPKLDTDISRAKPSHDVPVRLERERSPYRSTPRTKETRFSGEYLLSPEAMSPRMRHPEPPSGPIGPPKRASSITPENMAQHKDHGPPRALRPSMIRHASAMAYSRESGTATRSPTYHGLKEPLYDAVAPARCNSSRPDAVLPDSRHRSSAFLQGLASEHPTGEGRTPELPSASQARHLSLVSPTATRAASVGAPPATLPPCPRSIPVGGHNDWYSLHSYPSFKICPTCREAIGNAGYGRHLVAAFSKSPERPVRCAFSIPWVRMAYLLMVKKRRSDMSLLYDMADVAEDAAPCPGKRAAAREWYRIHDIDSDRKVPGFYACPYCIQNLEAIFPTLEGIFQKSRSHQSVEERTCSLGFDSSRFATYVDLLEDTANQAKEYRRAPNMYRFVELAKKMEAIPPCSRDDMLRGKTWHVIPKLPEFTACSDCYEEVVWPAVLQGLPLAKQFTRYPQTVEKAQVGVSCQMYSSRMRKVFLEACSDDDFDYLSRVALKRYRIERDLQRRITEAQRLPRAQREMAMEDIVDEWQDWD
ncbi:MAG: hypothetical protein Q9173_005121 [Seirophora scorigena]